MESEKLKCGLCFVGIIIINLMVAIDSTTLSVALPTIAHELDANVTAIYWTGTSFVLCSAVFQPVFASIASIGRKVSLFIALTFFALGSIICAVAHSISTLLAGRCLQGIGGGGIIVLTYVLMADLFDLQQRSKFITVIGLTWMTGTVCGPVIGGGFTQSASWRWIFWLNLPFCAISYVFVAIFIRPMKMNGTLKERLSNVDWIGIVLFSMSLTSILIGVSWGGVMFPWSSWQTTLPMYLGSLVLVFFLVYSYCLSGHPLIPAVVLKEKTAAITYFGTFLQGLIQFALLYYLPLYFELAKKFSPTKAGVALISICAVSGILTSVTGFLIAKIRRIKPFNIAGWLFMCIGLAQMNLLDDRTTTLGWLLINLPMSAGLGSLYSSLAMATQASVESRTDCSDSERLKIKAMAAGLNPFFRALGQSLGIAVGQAIFSNEMAKRYHSGSTKDLIALIEENRTNPPHNLTVSLVDSLRIVWWVLCALAGLALFMSLFTSDVGFAPSSQVNEKDATAAQREIDPEAHAPTEAGMIDGTTLTMPQSDPDSHVAAMSARRNSARRSSIH